MIRKYHFFWWKYNEIKKAFTFILSLALLLTTGCGGAADNLTSSGWTAYQEEKPADSNNPDSSDSTAGSPSVGGADYSDSSSDRLLGGATGSIVSSSKNQSSSSKNQSGSSQNNSSASSSGSQSGGEWLQPSRVAAAPFRL